MLATMVQEYSPTHRYRFDCVEHKLILTCVELGLICAKYGARLSLLEEETCFYEIRTPACITSENSCCFASHRRE